VARKRGTLTLAGKVAGLVVAIQRFVFEESDSDFGRGASRTFVSLAQQHSIAL